MARSPISACPIIPRRAGSSQCCRNRSLDQTDAAARTHRRGRGRSRRLDARPVHARRRKRLFLRSRRFGRQGDGVDLDRYDDPPEARRAATPAHGQARAHLRRRDHLRLQRRAVSCRSQARADRRGVRAERGRRGHAEPGRQPRDAELAGRRESLAKLPASGDQSRRPQLAAGASERDRGAGAGAGETRRARVPPST